jgi:hypothetical protein
VRCRESLDETSISESVRDLLLEKKTAVSAKVAGRLSTRRLQKVAMSVEDATIPLNGAGLDYERSSSVQQKTLRFSIALRVDVKCDKALHR